MVNQGSIRENAHRLTQSDCLTHLCPCARLLLLALPRQQDVDGGLGEALHARRVGQVRQRQRRGRGLELVEAEQAEDRRELGCGVLADGAGDVLKQRPQQVVQTFRSRWKENFQAEENNIFDYVTDLSFFYNNRGRIRTKKYIIISDKSREGIETFLSCCLEYKKSFLSTLNKKKESREGLFVFMHG